MTVSEELAFKALVVGLFCAYGAYQLLFDAPKPMAIQARVFAQAVSWLLAASLVWTAAAAFDGNTLRWLEALGSLFTSIAGFVTFWNGYRLLRPAFKFLDVQAGRPIFRRVWHVPERERAQEM